MGFGSWVAETLISVKGDTSHAKQAVRDYRGEEKKLAKDALANIERENASLDATVAKWGKITFALGSAVLAYKGIQAAAKNALEDMRLEAAAGAADIDRLRTATNGLIETDKLLAFAGKAQAGVWHLNQEEMETVLKGATALRKTMGVELEPTVQALTEAITKGSTRALKEFGIEAKDKEGALRQLDRMVRQLGGNTKLAGDDFEAAGTQMSDALDDLAGAIGKLALELTPAIRKMADFATSLADAATSSKWIEDKMGRGELGIPAMMKWRELQDKKEHEQAQVKAVQDNARLVAGAKVVGAAIWDAFVESAQKSSRGGGGGRGGSRRAYDGGDPAAALAAIGAAGAAIGRGAVGAYGDYQQAGAELRSNATSVREQNSTIRFQQDMAAIREDWQSWYPQMQAQLEEMRNQPTVLEQIFGKPDEITATTLAIQAAAMAVDGLTNSIAASFEAAVTGSDSAIGAFKKVAGGAVHAIGKELATVGAKEAIMALVSLATGDFSGAGRHGIASAAAFAGSAAAFKVAQEMGYGAGGSAARPSGAGAGAALGGGRGGTASTESTERNTVIMLGRDFGMFTDLEQRQLINQAIRTGNAEDGGTKHVRFR